MKPKPYRKTKSTKGSNLAEQNKTNSGGGTVAGVIKGPISSIGTDATPAHTEQGNDKSNPHWKI